MRSRQKPLTCFRKEVTREYKESKFTSHIEVKKFAKGYSIEKWIGNHSGIRQNMWLSRSELLALKDILNSIDV